MIVLGFDTATSATAVGLRLADGSTLQARDDPAPGAHPGHATRLLELAHTLLTEAGIGWSAVERIAVGAGPGTFTGLRVGVATARGLAQSLEVELVSVSSLRALAEPAREEAEGAVLAAIDARRGEMFVAGYLAAAAESSNGLESSDELISPRALPPEEVGNLLASAGAPWLAVGDGAVRYREQLERAGAMAPEDGSPLHLVSAEAICELGVRATATNAQIEAILPDYRRRPDAEIALESTSR
ncbi:MAG TPA: tRNA (adenosine(37)-N6)-threonylcarbamoyltransferase complex dimerization subunit type 1 TsaB [Solirubrobacteraceae bacterium]|jgi:tRNA threonylcarbamoyladenosine biosynthesis protein TsaB